ncbi:MAG TPA: hypothetical protein VFM34_12120 [Moraxellaceae bacterium]|nr:hypothetical protein [Moraxellaceae bacterium]
MTPDQSPDAPAPRRQSPRSALAALQEEFMRLVADLDSRHWQSYHERSDDPFREVRKARDLGGAGNFGGGKLDDR